MAAVYAPAFLHSVTRDADFHGLLVGNYQSRHQESLRACFMALHALQVAGECRWPGLLRFIPKF
jgi:hypothetical protein